MLAVADIVTAIQHANLQCSALLRGEEFRCVELSATEVQVITVGIDILHHLASSDIIEVTVLITECTRIYGSVTSKGRRHGAVTKLLSVLVY